MVGEVELVGLAGGGGAARGHLGFVGVPIVAVDEHGGGHAAGGGDDAGRADGAGDVGRVIDGSGAVHHDGPGAGREFLVGAADGAAVPHADGQAGAGNGIRGETKHAGAGANGGVGVVGGEVNRAIVFEVDDFAHGSVGTLDANGQSAAASALFGGGSALLLKGAHALDGAAAVVGVGEIAGLFENVGDARRGGGLTRERRNQSEYEERSGKEGAVEKTKRGKTAKRHTRGSA